MAQQRRPSDPSSRPTRPFSFQVDAQNDHDFSSVNQQHTSAAGSQDQRPPSAQYTPIDDNTQDSVDLNNLLRQAQIRYGEQQQQQQQVVQDGQVQDQHGRVGSIPLQEPAQSHIYPPPPSDQILSSPQQYQQQQFPAEKLPERMPTAYQGRPPEEPHPAVFAPFAETTPTADRGQQQQQQWQSQQSPHQEQKVGDAYAGSTTLKTDDGFKGAAYSPSTIGSPKPTFAPDAFAGPNGIDLSTAHQPGQIAHPNMRHAPPQASGSTKPLPSRPGDRSWISSLFSCPDTSTCCLGLFCPCILYSRTTYRLSQRSRKADATDLLGFSTCNGQCTLFALACGFQGILTGILSTRVRHAYEIEGGVFDDFCAGCCCSCCALIRDEHEVSSREERRRLWAGPAAASPAVGMGISSPTNTRSSVNGYGPVQGMQYQPHGQPYSRQNTQQG